jgi:hypothetical protein
MSVNCGVPRTLLFCAKFPSPVALSNLQRWLWSDVLRHGARDLTVTMTRSDAVFLGQGPRS